MQASCLLFSLSLEDSLQAGAWQQPPSPGSTHLAPLHPSPAGNFKSPCSGIRGMLAHHSQTLSARPACLLIPLAPLPTSFLFPFNLVVHLPPGLSLHLAKFPIPAARRHVVRDAKPSRSSSGIQVSAERTSPLEGQWNISSPAISRKTDGSTWGERGGGLWLGGGGGEKALLPTLGLVLCSVRA